MNEETGVDVRRLRAIIKRHGKMGVLFVACYLVAHRLWHHRRGVCIVAGMTLLLTGGIMLRLLFHHTIPSKVLSVRSVPAAVPPPPPLDKAKLEHALKEAEKQLAQIPDVPPIANHPYASGFNLSEARETFLDIVAKYGKVDRACIGLAQCEMRMGLYEESEEDWNHALDLSPNNPAAREGKLHLRPLLEAKQAFAKRVPDGHIITCICPVQVRSDQRYWAVLHGKDKEIFDGWHSPPDMCLTLFSDLPDGKQIGPSFPLHDARFGNDPLSSVDIWALDMTKDGIPELIVQEITTGGSWTPSQMEVFGWRGGQLAKILRVQSSEALCLEDINHDGTYQVRNFYEIGSTMCHAEQPRWSDVYAYQDGTFVLANRRFPKAFVQWADKLQTKLETYPGDPEIQAYLCLTYLLLRRDADAKSLYRQALAHFRKCLADANEQDRLESPAYKNCIRSYIRDIQH